MDLEFLATKQIRACQTSTVLWKDDVSIIFFVLHQVMRSSLVASNSSCFPWFVRVLSQHLPNSSGVFWQNAHQHVYLIYFRFIQISDIILINIIIPKHLSTCTSLFMDDYMFVQYLCNILPLLKQDLVLVPQWSHAAPVMELYAMLRAGSMDFVGQKQAIRGHLMGKKLDETWEFAHPNEDSTWWTYKK